MLKSNSHDGVIAGIDPLALRPADLPAANAFKIAARWQEALVACLKAGRLEQLRWYFVTPGGSTDLFAAKMIQSMGAYGLFAVSAPTLSQRRRRVRLTVTGEWYARTLYSAAKDGAR